MNRLIHGKNLMGRIVSLEPGDNTTEVFVEDHEGNVSSSFVPNAYFILFHEKPALTATRLKGDLHYKWGMKYTTREEYVSAKALLRSVDTYTVYNPRENFMIRTGYTYFKDMKHTEPSILSFDIETSGLLFDSKSRVFLISNTFRRNGKVTKKLFAYDQFGSEGEMLLAWTKWVRDMNPSIITGHNIVSYDLPYLNHVADLNGISLRLGRNNSPMKFDRYDSKFRKDQTQNIEYKKAHIYGREIIDTLFLAIKADIVAKKYETLQLKYIIKKEGLEKPGRTFYDASQIRYKFDIPEEWEKIKAYCVDDGDDGLALFDLFIPPFFYFTQAIPKSFQGLVESATGSQLNSLLVRSYLQEGHSIPKATEKFKFEGAISWGNPGIWKNCIKWDVKSLYPSLILQYEIEDREKDPNRNFIQMVEYFTKERLRNKEMAEKTGEKYWNHLESSQKIGINSAYGLLNTAGLNFNSPPNAAEVTRKGRETLLRAIEWATGKDFYKDLNPTGIPDDGLEESVEAE